MIIFSALRSFFVAAPNSKKIYKFTIQKVMEEKKSFELKISTPQNLPPCATAHVAHPVSIMIILDCFYSDGSTLKTSSRISFSSISNHVENNAWKEKPLYLPASTHKKNLSTSSNTVKYACVSGNNMNMSYRDLYQIRNASYLEWNDPKYRLSANNILKQLSVRFVLILCKTIVDSMSIKSKYYCDPNLRVGREIESFSNIF